MSDLTFVVSDLLAAEATAAFAHHQNRVLTHLPNAEVRHVGGTSLPGLLTTGDVDILIRVERQDFANARRTLSELYVSLHVDAWTSEAAFFEAARSTPHVEFTLTVVGSLTDFHHGDAWRQIATNSDLRDQYNAMKRAHDRGSIEEYLAAKRAYFRDNFSLDGVRLQPDPGVGS